MGTQLQGHTLINNNEVVLKYTLLTGDRVLSVDFTVYRLNSSHYAIKGRCVKGGGFTHIYYSKNVNDILIEEQPQNDDVDTLTKIEYECRELMNEKVVEVHKLDQYYVRGDLENVENNSLWQERLNYLTVDHRDINNLPVEGTGYTKQQINNLLPSVPTIVDDLTSKESNATLSARQGAVLKGLIDGVKSLLISDDISLDELQEIVAYIKQNRSDLQNLHYTNIAGLESALKLDIQKVIENGGEYKHTSSLGSLEINIGGGYCFVYGDKQGSSRLNSSPSGVRISGSEYVYDNGFEFINNVEIYYKVTESILFLNKMPLNSQQLQGVGNKIIFWYSGESFPIFKKKYVNGGDYVVNDLEVVINQFVPESNNLFVIEYLPLFNPNNGLSFKYCLKCYNSNYETQINNVTEPINTLGNSIMFDKNRDYGLAIPINTFTVDLTDAKRGIVQYVYFNGTELPTNSKLKWINSSNKYFMSGENYLIELEYKSNTVILANLIKL